MVAYTGFKAILKSVSRELNAIGHFPSSKNPHFQNEAKCTTFLVKMIFICMRMKKHFHIKGWAINLVLIQRPGVTRKWPFALYIMTEFHSGPLSLRHEHQKIHYWPIFFSLQNLRWSTSGPVPYKCQILTIVVLIVVFPIGIHGHACYKCLSLLPACARLNDSHCLASNIRELKQLQRRRHQLQKTIGLMIKTTDHAFSTFLWRPLHDYDVKPPGGRGHTTTYFPFSFWNWIKSLRIQLREKWPEFHILEGPNRRH